MRRYKLFTNTGSLVHEAGLVAPRTYVGEAMNMGGVRKSYNYNFLR